MVLDNKIIIIVLIIVAIVGLIAGVSAQIFSKTQYNFTVINQSNAPVNNTIITNNTPTQTNNTSTNSISEAEAINIAKQVIPPGDPIVEVLAFNTPPPRYIIYYEDPNNPNSTRGSVALDAKTGQIISTSTPS